MMAGDLGDRTSGSWRFDVGFRHLFWASALALVALAGLLTLAEEAEAGTLWFDGNNFTLSSSLEDGFNDTLTFSYDIDTEVNETEDALIIVNVTNEASETVHYFEVQDDDINGTADENLIWSWSCHEQTTIRTGNYTFRFQLLNRTGNQTFETLNTTARLEAAEEAWFENKTFELSDSLGMGYNDTIRWTLPLVTREGHAQEGVVVVIVYNATLGVYDTFELDYNVTGNSSAPLRFNWTAGQSGNHSFYFYVYNATSQLRLHFQSHDVELFAFPQEAWFNQTLHWLEDQGNDTFEDTIHFELDLATWDNWTQEGWIDITVREVQSGATLNLTEVYFNVTGNVSDDVIHWNWSAGYTDRYSFTIVVSNLTRELVFQQLYFEERLKLPYEFMWFDLDSTRVESRYTFVDCIIDIDTWENWTQEILLNITVFNGSIPHIQAIESIEHRTNITGEAFDPFIWRWNSTEDGDYTFGIWLYNVQGELFNSRAYEFRLQNVSEGAWFDRKVLRTTDLHDDGYRETVILEYDIDTIAGHTQEGFLNLFILDSQEQTVYHNSPGIPFNVTGEQDEAMSWQWTATSTGDFTLYLQLLNETATRVYHEENLTFGLHAPIEAAWFESKEYVVDNGTLNFTFNVDTWSRWTQEGVLFIDVLVNGSQLVNKRVMPFSVYGEANNDLMYWEWTAEHSGNYTITIHLVSRDPGTTFHNQTHNFQLNVPVIVPNRPPTAVATVMLVDQPATQTADKLEVELNGAIVFAPANVNDPDGDELTYWWTVDGKQYPGIDTVDGEGRLSWSFIKGGTYLVTLTVEDGRGGSHSDDVTVVAVLSQPVDEDDDDDGGAGRGALIGLVITAIFLVVLVVVAAKNKVK